MAAISRARPSGGGPNSQTTLPGPVTAIGPCRYSMAGYASVHSPAASRSFSAASLASPQVQPVPRKVNCRASISCAGSGAASTRRAAPATGARVLAQMRTEQRQLAGGEPGLHDRPLVGEVQRDDRVGGRRDGAARVGRDRDGRGRAAGLGEQVEDLGGGTRPGQRQDAVVPTAGRELGSGEGIGLAVTGRLARGRVRLGDEPRGAAARDRHPLARAGSNPGYLRGQPGGPQPALGLAGDFRLDARRRLALPSVPLPSTAWPPSVPLMPSSCRRASGRSRPPLCTPVSGALAWLCSLLLGIQQNQSYVNS